ncbi:MAG: DNA/RNA non-specific endonuclease [Lachnospiraceae bacterium]|nr:DNA/RNA non-specific endonuclease [Lachnospiraceae bacterium]
MFTMEDEVIINNDENISKPFVELGCNKPSFTKDEIEKGLRGHFEEYAECDKLGRCVAAFACFVEAESESVDKPKYKSRMKPTAWKSIGCDYIKDGKILYNRCHLIGNQLAAKKADKRGVITGTRAFNVEGMFQFEDKVAKYIEKNQDHHVLYRVTPYFKEDDLLSYGVQMETLDIDDEESFSWNVFIYNKQSGFDIEYRNGDVYSDYPLTLSGKRLDCSIYVIDMDTNKFHKESCADIYDIKNKKYFVGNKQIIEEKYCQCETCII